MRWSRWGGEKRGSRMRWWRRSSVRVGIKGKVVKTGCNVMGSTCVRVPILIIVEGRKCGGMGGGLKQCGLEEVGLKRWGGGIMKVLVESISTGGSRMANFGADLTRRSGGMGWWVR
ncbi:hypothetical protein F0562_005506 [Nyssa sinensis]|uniref:Uncharacterized protein n=1 Tax=Nyssa sinensis TaxID=561372 RepID=A0A5J5AJP8_9ASTE|nr:hypothetical protein F0562_005506 [Nyssa sinensis]